MVKKIGLVWEEPGERPRRSQSLDEIVPLLEQLKARPKTWAKLGEWDGESGAYSARKILLKNADKLPGKYTFEIRPRLDDKNQKAGSMLYAKYEGERLPRPE